MSRLVLGLNGERGSVALGEVIALPEAFEQPTRRTGASPYCTAREIVRRARRLSVDLHTGHCSRHTHGGVYWHSMPMRSTISAERGRRLRISCAIS